MMTLPSLVSHASKAGGGPNLSRAFRNVLSLEVVGLCVEGPKDYAIVATLGSPPPAAVGRHGWRVVSAAAGSPAFASGLSVCWERAPAERRRRPPLRFARPRPPALPRCAVSRRLEANRPRSRPAGVRSKAARESALRSPADP